MNAIRYGRFEVIDRGEPTSSREAAADRPRYAVVEHDNQGPILRGGPFRTLQNAIDLAQSLDFRASVYR